MRETLNAKNTPLSTTPTATPAARLWVAMVTATVASMAALDRRGWRTRAPSDFQSNVSADTMTMMATSAITGTCDTQALSATIRMSRNTPANSVDRRPRPPYFTLPTAWPIIPQPAMPPKQLAAMLASAQARAFAVLVAGGVGQLVDHGGGQHRFEQAHHGNRQRG